TCASTSPSRGRRWRSTAAWRYLNLFGQLIPALSLSDPRPQPPRARFRGAFDAFEDEQTPARDDFAVDVVAVEPIAERGQVVGDRAMEAPVLRAEVGDVRRVHALVVVGDLVLQQEGDRVADVLFVQLDDLELCEQQLGERNRVVV